MITVRIVGGTPATASDRRAARGRPHLLKMMRTAVDAGLRDFAGCSPSWQNQRRNRRSFAGTSHL